MPTLLKDLFDPPAVAALARALKAAHPGALELLGVGERPRVRVGDLRVTPQRVRLGDTLRFELVLASTSTQAQSLMVDYAVHFVKASGEAKPKVFKLRRLELAPKDSVALAGKVSLQDLSTRKHYAGPHAIERLVNGVRLPLGTVRVSA